MNTKPKPTPEGKLRDILRPGNDVTIPTTYSGTHTGVVVALATMGPAAEPGAQLVTLRQRDGGEVEVLTSLNYTGYLNAEGGTVAAVTADAVARRAIAAATADADAERAIRAARVLYVAGADSVEYQRGIVALTASLIGVDAPTALGLIREGI